MRIAIHARHLREGDLDVRFERTVSKVVHRQDPETYRVDFDDGSGHEFAPDTPFLIERTFVSYGRTRTGSALHIAASRNRSLCSRFLITITNDGEPDCARCALYVVRR